MRRFLDGMGFARTREFKEMDTTVYGARGWSMVVGPAETEDRDVAEWLKNKPWGVGVVVMPEVDDVDALHARALKLDVEVEEPPTDQPWGSRTLRVVGPDGYSFMFEQELRAERPAKKAAKAKPARAAKAKPARGKPARAVKSKAASGRRSGSTGSRSARRPARRPGRT